MKSGREKTAPAECARYGAVLTVFVIAAGKYDFFSGFCNFQLRIDKCYRTE